MPRGGGGDANGRGQGLREEAGSLEGKESLQPGKRSGEKFCRETWCGAAGGGRPRQGGVRQ